MTKIRQLSDFRPAVRRRIHEDIAEQLRDAILDGSFAAGTKLPPERELALEFQVNRTSIRDAFKVLEGLNLVRVRQGDGATVQPISVQSPVVSADCQACAGTIACGRSPAERSEPSRTVWPGQPSLAVLRMSALPA